MQRALFIGELLLAIAAGGAGVLSWTLVFLLPIVVPPLVLAPFGVVKPDVFDRRVWPRRILHGASAMNAACVVAFGVAFAGSFAEPERHVVPAGYEGWVHVVFAQRDGAPQEYDGERRVYRIPESGILLTQAAPNFGTFGPDDVECVDASGERVQMQRLEAGSSAGGSCEYSYWLYWAGSSPPIGSPPSDRVHDAVCRSR